MTAGVQLAELNWHEAAEAVERYSVAVLPIGAGTKEHGPHLPCGTDLFVVEELARRVVEVCPIILLPSLAYGYFPAFVDFPGSVSIAPPIFTGMVADIVRSLARHGTKKFLLLDGGVSTHFPLRTLCAQPHEELGVQMALSNILVLGAETKTELEEQESGGHADEMETSCMLVIRPDLVNMAVAHKEVLPSIAAAYGATGIQKFAVAGKMTTRSGINGDSTLATREKGEKILAAMTQDIVTFLAEFARL